MNKIIRMWNQNRKKIYFFSCNNWSCWNLFVHGIFVSNVVVYILLSYIFFCYIISTNTYAVTFYEDIISTGNIGKANNYKDYITVEKNSTSLHSSESISYASSIFPSLHLFELKTTTKIQMIQIIKNKKFKI